VRAIIGGRGSRRNIGGARGADDHANLTLHYDRMMLLLEMTLLAQGLVRKNVDVVNYVDGRFVIRYNGVDLPYKVFDKIQTIEPGAIVDNKHLTEALAYAWARQASYPATQRRHDAMRPRPPNNVEAPGLPSKRRPRRAGTSASPV